MYRLIALPLLSIPTIVRNLTKSAGKKDLTIVNTDSMQFGYMSVRGTTDALFAVGRMQEEYRDKKLCMCFVDIEKAFDESSKKCDGVGDEKKRFTRGNCKCGNELLSRGKNESSSGI